jgi:hypothetical protein
MAITISTASNHPRILHAHLSTKWTWIVTKPVCKIHWKTTKTILPKLALLSYTNGTPIPPHDIDSIWATTSSIMLYIAVHLLAAGGAAISESQLKILCNQAEKCAMEFVRAESAQSSLNSVQAPDPLSPTQSAIVGYTAELNATINRHHDSILQLLKLSATIKPLPNLSRRYDELRDASFPIISGLATPIMHLGGEEISHQELEILTTQAKSNALELHTASIPPKVPSPPPVVTPNCSDTGNAPSLQVPQDPILPPGKM